MSKIEITKTELVWPGKYNEDGTRKEVERASLPFQVIETINEARATREAAKKPKQKSLFEMWQAKEGDTFEEGWRNKLIWGDNLLVMCSLLEKFAGKIDLIYIDPPFATGADFSFTTEIGDTDVEVFKKQSIIEEKAYRDTWGKGIGSYLHMIYDRLVLMRELLSESGTIFVHLDWRVSHYVKPLLDEIFGGEQFLNEVIRQKTMSRKAQSKSFGNLHDTIFLYSKSVNYIFFPQLDMRGEEARNIRFPEVEEGTGLRYVWDNFTQAGNGPPRKFGSKILAPPSGKHWIWTQERIDEAWEKGIIQIRGNMPRLKRYETEGLSAGDLWTGKEWVIHSQSLEATGYDTQKPESLLDRVIKACSEEKDLVADFFCGSGTTLAVAEKLGRRWIGCDLSRWAIHVTRKRLLEIENCKPFEVLNLGKYERKYWQGVTFGDKKKSDRQLAIYQYLAFILKLYGAEPISGMQHLHGKKGKAVVHVGAVDAPVTIDEINACLDECLAIQQKELHILGWEWEMGLYDLMTDAAKGRGVKLVLLNIPREVMEQQAVDKGDIQFFELAYLEMDIKQEKGRKIVVSLKDFVIPNTELIPEEIRSKIKKWSDYIDYWAIDWDFQNDTFMNGWVTYRTRKDRTLALKSDAHSYEKPGKYTVMVKVVDIFGNDTSQAFEVEVK